MSDGRDVLTIERLGDRSEIAVWTLARPEAKNALDSATFAALGRAIAAAGADPTLRAIVLTGEGDTFASGGDLRELRTATTSEHAAQLADMGRHVCEAIARLGVPVIAALPGPAIGGGAELAIACDLRIADARASFCFKHARMGVTTAWGVLAKLVGAVGHATASRLLLAGHTIDSGEAFRLGLVDDVTEHGGSGARAIAWGLDIAQASPGAIAELKGLLREALGVSAELCAKERDRFIAAWTSADHREAVEAFFGSRAPRWTSR
jgi:enoyl-CoA hydratase/carnithine racemase